MYARDCGWDTTKAKSKSMLQSRWKWNLLDHLGVDQRRALLGSVWLPQDERDQQAVSYTRKFPGGPKPSCKVMWDNGFQYKWSLDGLQKYHKNTLIKEWSCSDILPFADYAHFLLTGSHFFCMQFAEYDGHKAILVHMDLAESRVVKHDILLHPCTKLLFFRRGRLWFLLKTGVAIFNLKTQKLLKIVDLVFGLDYLKAADYQETTRGHDGLLACITATDRLLLVNLHFRGQSVSHCLVAKSPTLRTSDKQGTSLDLNMVYWMTMQGDTLYVLLSTPKTDPGAVSLGIIDVATNDIRVLERSEVEPEMLEHFKPYEPKVCCPLLTTKPSSSRCSLL